MAQPGGGDRGAGGMDDARGGGVVRERDDGEAGQVFRHGVVVVRFADQFAVLVDARHGRCHVVDVDA